MGRYSTHPGNKLLSGASTLTTMHDGDTILIEFHDPRATVGTPMEPYTLAHHFSETGAGSTIGLLANGFPDSDNFLASVGQALSQRMPALQVRNWNKGNPTVTASEKILADIQANCQAVVAAYGH